MDQFKQVKGRADRILSGTGRRTASFFLYYGKDGKGSLLREVQKESGQIRFLIYPKKLKSIVPLPVIGIIKKQYPGTEVYITPSMNERRRVA